MVITTNSFDTQADESLKYFLNFWCIFDNVEFYNTLFIVLCVLEIAIIIMMILKSLKKAVEMTRPSEEEYH